MPIPIERIHQILDKAKDEGKVDKVELCKKVISIRQKLEERKKKREEHPFNVGVRKFSDEEYQKHFAHQLRK